jgi:hypothetical protein
MLLLFPFVSFSNSSVDLSSVESLRVSKSVRDAYSHYIYAAVCHIRITEVATLCVANECSLSEDCTSLECDAVSMDKQ